MLPNTSGFRHPLSCVCTNGIGPRTRQYPRVNKLCKSVQKWPKLKLYACLITGVQGHDFRMADRMAETVCDGVVRNKPNEGLELGFVCGSSHLVADRRTLHRYRCSGRVDGHGRRLARFGRAEKRNIAISAGNPSGKPCGEEQPSICKVTLKIALCVKRVCLFVSVMNRPTDGNAQPSLPLQNFVKPRFVRKLKIQTLGSIRVIN